MDNDLHRTLIEKINQLVSIIQLIFNEIGDPVDHITLYMNPAAETELGLKEKKLLEGGLRKSVQMLSRNGLHDMEK